MPVSVICLMRHYIFNYSAEIQQKEGKGKMIKLKKGVNKFFGRMIEKAMNKEPGIDGILVTVGLCIIALLLCVVMKGSMSDFITSIVGQLTQKAGSILSGTIII